MGKTYFRPIAQRPIDAPDWALPLADTWCVCAFAERIERGESTSVITIDEVPAAWREAWTRPLALLLGQDHSAPRIMGIVNATPDSFSDGGQLDTPEGREKLLDQMGSAHTEIVDVGGESTRPGAEEIHSQDEINRISPVITGALRRGFRVSVDTRKADVAEAAIVLGAQMINDVSGLEFDLRMASVVRDAGVPLCVMHSRGTPRDMQSKARYTDVLLDTYDELEHRLRSAQEAGIAETKLIADPGIGFAKNRDHNLILLRRLSLFHGLGVPLLVGASRKRFIGEVTETEQASDRTSGSLTVTLAAVEQGVQIHRVHDVLETRRAFRMRETLS